jgi:hypothetical protein
MTITQLDIHSESQTNSEQDSYVLPEHDCSGVPKKCHVELGRINIFLPRR